MRRTPRTLTDAREELAQIEQEFTQLQKRIEVVQDSVANALVRLFGEERPGFTGLQEEAFMDRIAERVVARLGTTPKSQAQGDKRYVRDVEAAKFLGVSAATLRSWRSRGEPSGPPVTRMSKMVMYSVKGLEQYMEERTVEGR
jgi:DNA-binding transcriptional MerR regulator